MTLPQHLPAVSDVLPAHVINNHTHLRSITEYSGLDVADSFTAAGMVGVAGAVDVGYDLPSSRVATQPAATDPRIRAAVAAHLDDVVRPLQRGGLTVLDVEPAELPALAVLPGVTTAGETDLDYYYIRDVEA